jgi:hypothetical protein
MGGKLFSLTIILGIVHKTGTVNNPRFFGVFVVVFLLGPSRTLSTLRSCTEKRLKKVTTPLAENFAYKIRGL